MKALILEIGKFMVVGFAVTGILSLCGLSLQWAGLVGFMTVDFLAIMWMGKFPLIQVSECSRYLPKGMRFRGAGPELN